MILDHVGVVVPSIADAEASWREVFGYRRGTETVLNARQRVRVAFFDAPGSLPIKLIEPGDPGSPVSALARRGGGVHHLCFRVDSVEAEVARLQALGLHVVAPPQPGEAFAGHEIAFVYAGGGIHIEVIDTLERAGLLGDRADQP